MVAKQKIHQKREERTTLRHKNSSMMPLGRWMTLQHNHCWPSVKSRLRRGLARLLAWSLCQGIERIKLGDNNNRFFNDAFKKETPLWPSRRNRFFNDNTKHAGQQEHWHSFCLESYANALIDSHGTEGGTHRQFVHAGMEEGGGLIDCHDTMRSHSWTRPQQWEARTSNHPCMDAGGSGGLPATTTPWGAIPKLARESGRRPSASNNTRWREVAGCLHTTWSRS